MMTCKEFWIYFLLGCNIGLVSAIVYSCDRTAQCGCSKTDASLNKIVGGEDSVLSSWGWAVSLRDEFGDHFCGGAIISPLHIITAAHCVHTATSIIQYTKVVVGIDQLLQSSSSIAQVRSVTHVFSHPLYNRVTKANDIAVLRLSQPLTISTQNATARLCLPRVELAHEVADYPIDSSPLVAIGWGTLWSGATSVPFNLHLQQVTVNAVAATHRTCATSIYDRQVQFCAGVTGGGKDTCQGDSGGPLMRFESAQRRWVLAGVTSYGRGCGLADYAGVYTRVSVYLDWLRSMVTDGFIEAPVVITASPSTDSPILSTSSSTVSTRSTIFTTSSSNLSTVPLTLSTVPLTLSTVPLTLSTRSTPTLKNSAGDELLKFWIFIGCLALSCFTPT